MESDSESSDGSHISATPPRESNPPPSRPALRSSNKSRIRVRASSSNHSTPILKSKKLSSNPPSNSDPTPTPTPTPKDRSPIPSPLSGLPFQIRRPSDQISAISTVETLPARHLSSSASFSKFRRPSLNFEDDPSPPPVFDSESHVESSGTHRLASGLVSQESKSEAVNTSNPVKKHPNLIGGNAPQPPVKLRKCGNEGNFVRLNLNRSKRRFLNKGSRSRNSYVSGGRKYYRKRRRKLEGEGEPEKSTCEEDGLVVESVQQKQRKESQSEKSDGKLIEEVVSVTRNEPSDENLVKLLKVMYGYDSFRDGQLDAIKMVLAGESVMLVLPTGAGKSLCYQLPAMILPGITVVVSPLIALMIDQLKQLPPMIQGGLLCSSQTAEQVSETLRQIQERTIKVLYVSPERFFNAEFLSLFSTNLSASLVVVDEAHCISEWSHNFRPSYTRLRASMLRASLNVKCILAMTATATITTLHDVMFALAIPQTNIIQKAQLRDNLQLSVSLSGNRLKDLLMLLNSHPFKEVHSIIVYCKFQSETDQISRYLCDNNISAKSYHGGIPARDRTHTQELFCSNKIRVVIHYSLPESLEEYVQEIGRAGRDGRLSYCHLLFDDDTYFKLRSLMHSEGVDEYAINKFLSEVFASEKNLHGKICSLVKESASRKFDMKEEVMLTILTHLELGEVQYLRLLAQLNVTCTLNFHKTPPVLLAEKDIAVAAILKKSETKQGQYVFDIPTTANSIGITATDLSNQLQNLKLKGEITYELKDPAYCYTIMEVPGDFCSLSAHLTKWLAEVEISKVRKLNAMFDAVVFAVNGCEKMHGCYGCQHTPCLQRKIMAYFNGEDNSDISNKTSQSSPFLRADIKVFLQSNSHTKFTPRAVARIMHGIASPAYTSTMWSKTHFWGRYTQIDFQMVMEAAKAELMNFVGKDAL
ncbi:ATP-dependent DNA helicase Q-like 5 isoform X2 [Juglans microcarpa x Juglans regia]|uniref:ATP-dependent DNA helicase Q-like 5 isoform X2 n=1 Tax=Juglans microcarpa x Juglans regia TaxID=2249226 RepID=UPI001B7DF685|nr:ATP-dependent DNA helicase Q-like 5 isoform X2 [Juglans microcarpa x Juglans regia]